MCRQIKNTIQQGNELWNKEPTSNTQFILFYFIFLDLLPVRVPATRLQLESLYRTYPTKYKVPKTLFFQEGTIGCHLSDYEEDAT